MNQGSQKGDISTLERKKNPVYALNSNPPLTIHQERRRRLFGVSDLKVGDTDGFA